MYLDYVYVLYNTKVFQLLPALETKKRSSPILTTHDTLQIYNTFDFFGAIKGFIDGEKDEIKPNVQGNQVLQDKRDMVAME